MASKGKELYKTFKRSFSGVGDVLGQSSSGNSSSAKYGGGSGKTWIHPPDVLINGRVEYSVKFFGTREVDKAKGTDTIRDALTAIRFQIQVKHGETGHSGSKLQKVDIQINIEGVTIVDTKTKMVLYRYPLPRISFAADDKQDKRIFSFIARAEEDVNRHDCFIFLSDKMAEQITLTIGEAFDLAYKRYMDKNKTTLENQKNQLIMKKKIAELEDQKKATDTHSKAVTDQLVAALRENARLRDLLQNHGLGHLTTVEVPNLPSTPMPRGPPPGMSPSDDVYSVPLSVVTPEDPFADILNRPSEFAPTVNTNLATHTYQNVEGSSSSSLSGPAPVQSPPPCPTLAPPPPVAPRRSATSKKEPEVGRRLENLQLDKFEDVFDDSFNPRATEKKMAKEYDPFGEDFLEDVLGTGNLASKNTLEKAENATADELQAMIDKVDKKLEDMRDAFAGGSLETGEMNVNDSFRDLDESDYGTPVDRVNPEAVKK